MKTTFLSQARPDLKPRINRSLGVIMALGCSSLVLASCQTSGAQQKEAATVGPPAVQNLAHPAAPAKVASFAKALWVWDAGVITDAAKQKDLFAFCKSKGLTIIYQDMGSAFLEAETATKAKHQISTTALAAYLKAAHAQGFKVEVLDGDPSFALTPNHARTLARVQKALDYNKTAAIDARLDGFQWDTEPYILPEFKTPEGERAILVQYLDSAVQMRDAVKKAGQPAFTLGYAIPFWMDGDEHQVEWNGIKKSGTFHLMDILNGINSGYIAIMAYRDKAEGSNGSIGITQGEADYATKSAPNVRVWVGQETLDVKGDPPSITFWQEGEGELNKALDQIKEHYKNTPAVAGAAIHHYESYREISERPAAKPVTREFKITSPQAGPADVGIEVKGTASTGQKVLVAVKPDGDIWYDQGTSPVSPEGEWTVPVRLGNEGTKPGSGFTIRATLKSADDKVVSELEVKVTRK